MNLKRRITTAERAIACTEYRGPVSMIELIDGVRDATLRRTLGPDGVRMAGERIQALIERLGGEPCPRPDINGGNESTNNSTFANPAIELDCAS